MLKLYVYAFVNDSICINLQAQVMCLENIIAVVDHQYQVPLISDLTNRFSPFESLVVSVWIQMPWASIVFLYLLKVLFVCCPSL